MEFSDEVAGRFHRSSRSEKIVVEEYHVILIDGVFVNLNGVDAVFFGITLLYGLAGRLAGFLQSTIPAPSLIAAAELMTKPLLSMPTILVIPLSL